MTNKELQEKIARLETELARVKEVAEAMKKRVDGGVFKPEDGQEYWRISGTGDAYKPVWSNHPVDHEYYSIGNCFPTQQAAEDFVRASKLIQRARESQDGLVPEWEDSTHKYLMHFDGSRIWTIGYNSLNTALIFGYWEDRSVCEQFIQDNHDEILWFFTEYRR